MYLTKIDLVTLSYLGIQTTPKIIPKLFLNYVKVSVSGAE